MCVGFYGIKLRKLSIVNNFGYRHQVLDSGLWEVSDRAWKRRGLRHGFVLTGFALLISGCTNKFLLEEKGVVYDKDKSDQVVLKFTAKPEVDASKISLKVDDKDNSGSVTSSVDDSTGDVTFTLPSSVEGDKVEFILLPGAVTYGGRSFVKTFTFDNKAPEVESVETSETDSKVLILNFSEKLTRKTSFSTSEIEKFKLGDLVPKTVSMESGYMKLKLTFENEVDLTYKLTVGSGLVKDDVTDVDSTVQNENKEQKDLAVKDKTLPTLSDQDFLKDGVQSLVIDREGKTLTIHFSEEMDDLAKKSDEKIEVYRGSKKLSTTEYDYSSLSSDKRSLEIKITNSAYWEEGVLKTGDGYSVKFLSGSVEDSEGNKLAVVTTERTLVPEDSTPPKFAEGDSFTVDTLMRIFEVKFSENVKQEDSEVELYWESSSSTSGYTKVDAGDYELSVTDRVLRLEIKDTATSYLTGGGLKDGDKYKFKFLKGAIKDLSSNELEADKETEVVVVDATAPTLRVSNSLLVDREKKTLTVVFSEDVRKIVGVDLKTKVKLTGELTVDGSTDTSKFVSVVVSNNNTLVITLGEAILAGDYGVEVVSGALEDFFGNDFGGGSTETDTVEATAPSMATPSSLVVNVSAKTFTVTFDEDIRAIEGVDLKSKVKVIGTNGGLSVDGTKDTSKIASVEVSGRTLVVTLKEVDVTKGDYAVGVLDGGVEDLSGNDFGGGTTEKDTTEGFPALLTIQDSSTKSALLVDASAKTFTVTFNENIRLVSGVDLKTKVKISGKLSIDGTTDVSKIGSVVIANSNSLVITITDAILSGDYAVEVLGSAVEDLSGNAFGGDTTETDTVSALFGEEDLVGLGVTSDSDYGF